MPKQINTHLVGQSLVRMFGLKGRFQPVLDETIVPVVNVGETDSGQARLATGGIVGAAAGAGNVNNMFFGNPVGSSKVIRIKKFWAASGAPLTDVMNYQLLLAVVGAPSAGFWRDTSLGGAPVAQLARAAGAGIVLTPPLFHLDLDSTVWVHEIVLYPGWQARFRQVVQNNTLELSLQWTEEDITQSLGA